MRRKIILPAIARLCLLIFPVCGIAQQASSQSAGSIPAVTAKRSIDFLNSMGANSAISKRGETLAKTAEALQYTGLRWIRTGYEGDLPVSDLLSLHKQTGVVFSYGLLSGGNDIPRLIAGGERLAAAGALLAFEGPNEPNNWAVTYNGEQGGKNGTWAPVAKLQKNLYAAVKTNAALKAYPVWSLSETGAETDNTGLQFLIIPSDAGTLLPAGTKYADFANCHNYVVHPSWPGVHDNQVWNAASPGADSKVDGLYGNYGKTWGKKFKGYTVSELDTLPRVTTETGLTIGNGITEEMHGMLLMNNYLAQYARGWSYTAVYLLRDRSDEDGNQQFGFYKTDYTPRKAAFYLHNLTTVLADKPSAHQPGKLKYAVVKPPVTVHSLLLQKANGKFELVIWGERINGADVVEVNFDDHKAKITLYDPTVSTSAVQTLRNINAIKLTISNHPIIIEI
jgi:hypothetical protein